MKLYLSGVVLLGIMNVHSMVDDIPVVKPVVGEDVIERTDRKPMQGSRPVRLSGDPQLLSPAKLRSNPGALRALPKPTMVVVSPSARVEVVSDGPGLQEKGLTVAEREAIQKEGETASFIVKKPPVSPVSSRDIQKQIQRAENLLVRVVKLANQLHNHDVHGDDLSLVEEQLKAVEEFEETLSASNVVAVQESGLPEKIAAVKALLEDTISYKKEQLNGQGEVPVIKEPVTTVEIPEDQSLSSAFLKKEAQEKEQLAKIDFYVSQSLVKQILAQPVDSYTSSQLAVNLEVLGLRDFSLEEQLDRLPVDAPQRERLEEIRIFEMKAFQLLEKDAPDFSAVEDKILDQLGSTGSRGIFRKQAEEKIAFLRSKEIMGRLDASSQQYVQQVIREYQEAVHTTLVLLLHPDERLVSSLEKVLSSETPEGSSNSGYDQQNELYRSLLQVEQSHREMAHIVSGISLPLDFARDTYISQLRQFEKITGRKLVAPDPSGKEIAHALKTVLSPDFAMTFVDSKKESEYVLGQQLARALGKEVLDIPLGGLGDQNGYIVSEVEGQKIKLAFKKVIKELGVDSSSFSQLPTSWQYISHAFLKEIGEQWLRHFAKNNADLSEVERFKKEQILCEGWQISRMDLHTGTGRINLFRQMGTELMTYPMARSLQFESLESEERIDEPFSSVQRANATRLTGSLSVMEDPLASVSDEEFERQSGEQAIKMESIKKDFPQSIRDFSTYCNVKQGPARLGVSFLEDMQTTLFDVQRVKQLRDQKQLVRVVKELTAFQQSVLQGKSVDYFSNEWWQIELYHRAELFKQAVRSLEETVIVAESEDQEIQNFVKNIQVVLGDYQASSVKSLWKKRETLVLEQSTVFQAQAKQWESWNAKWKGQRSFESDELLILREQQESLSQFLQQVPLLLKQVGDLILHDPKSSNIKKLKAYRKQLQDAQKKYAPYLKQWNTLLENHSLAQVVAPLKLQVGYQKKAQKLVDMIMTRDEGTKWEALNTEYAQVFARNEGMPSGLLNKMSKAQANIRQLLADTPDLLESIDEYQGILSRSEGNEELLEKLTIVREKLVSQQALYKNYVMEWEKVLRKFGPHS